MIENLFIGMLVLLICLFIQSIAIAMFLKQYIFLKEKKYIKRLSIMSVALILVYSTFVMLLGNLIQIYIWALLFVNMNEFQSLSEAFYHSAVNFTTLGYGDIVMSNDRKLLGALEAVNGVIMFGLTTGFIYTVLNFLFGHLFHKRLEKVEN